MTPITITTIIEQLGGRGLRGAICYTGGHRLSYKHPLEGRDEECRSGHMAKPGPNGLVDYEVGLAFEVNGKRGTIWEIIVAYEPDDTYSVWLQQKFSVRKVIKTGKAGIILDQRHDVYCDVLQSTVEHVYDEAIKKHCEGFIPMR